MNSPLFIVKAHAAVLREDAFMPDVRVNVEAFAAIKCEADELLWRDVIRWQRKRHEKRFVLQRKEELAAIRVVVGMPKHHLGWWV